MTASVSNEAFLFAGGRYEILLSSDQTGDRFSVILATEPSGNFTPPHLHDIEWEVAYVTKGSLSVETRGENVTLGRDGVGVLPPGIAHRLGNAGECEAEYVLVTAPAQFERFARALGEPVAPSTPPRAMREDEIGNLVATAGDYGVRLCDETALNVSGSAEKPAPELFTILDGCRVEVLCRFDGNAQDLALLRLTIAPAKQLPEHATACSICLCPIDGEIEWRQDADHWLQARSKSALKISADTGFALRNAGTEVATVLLVADGTYTAFLKRAALNGADMEAFKAAADIHGVIVRP